MDEIFVLENFPPTCTLGLHFRNIAEFTHCFLPVADSPLLVEILRTCYAGV